MCICNVFSVKDAKYLLEYKVNTKWNVLLSQGRQQQYAQKTEKYSSQM